MYSVRERKEIDSSVLLATGKMALSFAEMKSLETEEGSQVKTSDVISQDILRN